LVAAKRAIDAREVDVNAWENQARVQVALLVLVAALGGVTMAVQGFSKKKWAKPTTVIVGAAVTVLTGTNGIVFPTDHRVLRRHVAKARSILTEARYICAVIDDTQTQQNQDALLKQVRDQIAQIERLGPTGDEGGEPAKTNVDLQAPHGFNGDPVVYAQAPPQKAPPQPPPAPSWLSQPPRDDRFLYFVGTGEDESYADAKKESYARAVEEATKYVANQAGSMASNLSSQEIDHLTDYVTRSSSVADTYLVYDRGARLYRHSTLLRLSKALSDQSALSAFLGMGSKHKWTRAEGRLPVPSSPAPGTPILQRVVVKAEKEKKGSFAFTFTVQKQAQGLLLKLDQIQIYEDGSGGTTRWLFDVLVNGKRAFGLSERNYHDWGKPTVYRPTTEDHAEGLVLVGPAATFDLQVVGSSPEA
jgi:hypothetical protein